MYKRRKVYICDHCGTVALPDYKECYDGFMRECIPKGRGCVFGGHHLCYKCYSAFEKLSEVK